MGQDANPDEQSVRVDPDTLVRAVLGRIPEGDPAKSE
jgi:hypothetical protein